MIYISLQLKKDLDIKGLIYFTNIFTLAIFIIDTIAQYTGLYETATEFFVLSWDMASHFAAGFVFFLIFVMFISIVEIKYKVENIALILTNVALFIWEILEELLELFYGGTLEGFANYFFWNGVQDLIFNFLGSITAFLIVKLYFKKKRKEIELIASSN